MENHSIWKRVGGWIKGNRIPKIGDDITSVDAEGVLVDITGDSTDEPMALKKNAPSMVAIQDGFGKLTDIIREMNENVSRHREQASELNKKISSMVEILPEGLSQQNKAFAELADQLQSQAKAQLEFADMLKTLPDDSRRQLENLNKIATTLESSLKSQVSQTEIFGQFNTSVKSVSEHSQAQAASLINIGRMLEENQKNLQSLITVQNKRFHKLFVTTIILALTAIASVATVVWLVMKSPQAS